ncbi:RNA polymerase sigma factor [Paenarthrobacter nitroguajacolicus]|uniref:RNA polymerase sigma factor n=1 Tax=Paenarthrobacter nitroguajacolicus TaxID=211146 RepID=UPI00248B00B2|nr:sigma-70 family RNA polymerase sigma factor [Paenarthrobacter nitroguajacolicus]MDI2034434.1 hypothetical protein [Paenarthrobacter nitroguajacolicus]
MIAADDTTKALSDEWLTYQVGKKDEDAFDTLYRRYARLVAWQARSLLRSGPAAEDATQSTFVILWKKASRITLEGESLLPWLLGVCRIECRSILAKNQVLAQPSTDNGFEGSSPDPGPEELVIQGEIVRQIEMHVSQMSELDQAIYRLCLLNELSYESAAKELGITHGAVRNRLSRLKSKHRRHDPNRETGASQ